MATLFRNSVQINFVSKSMLIICKTKLDDFVIIGTRL